jgi:hypothetical protein
MFLSLTIIKMATDENDLVRLKGFKCLKKKEKKNIYSYSRLASFKGAQV